jgi:hypothetical protein
MAEEKKDDMPLDLTPPDDDSVVSNFVTKQTYPKYTGDVITFSEKKNTWFVIRKIESTNQISYRYIFLIYEPGIFRGTWKYLSKDHNATIDAIKRMFGNSMDEQNPTLPVDVFFTLYKLTYPDKEPNSPNGPPTYTYTCTYDNGYYRDKKNPRWYLHYIPMIDKPDSRFSITNPKNESIDQNLPLLLRYDTDNTANNTTKKWICVQDKDEKAYIGHYFKDGIIPPGVLVAFSEHSLLKDIQNKNNPQLFGAFSRKVNRTSERAIRATKLASIKSELVRLKTTHNTNEAKYLYARSVIEQIKLFVTELSSSSKRGNLNNHLIPIITFYNNFLTGHITYSNGWLRYNKPTTRPGLLTTNQNSASNTINQIMDAIDECVKQKEFIDPSTLAYNNKIASRNNQPIYDQEVYVDPFSKGMAKPQNSVANPQNSVANPKDPGALRRLVRGSQLPQTGVTMSNFKKAQQKKNLKTSKPFTSLFSNGRPGLEQNAGRHTHKRTHRRKGTRRA